MKEKIKPALPWINVALITIIILAAGLILSNFKGPFLSRVANSLSWIGFVPTAEILDFDVNQSIAWFGGGESSFDEFMTSFAFSALGFITTMVIAPFLLVKGYEKIDKKDGQRGLVWYAGAALLTLAVSTTMIAAVVGTTSNIRIKQSVAESRSHDMLRADLMNLAFDAAEMMVLPREFGGGEGSFYRFSAENEGTRPLTLDDLQSYREDSGFEFVIHEGISDSSLTIIGVSDYEGDDPEFANADGRKGKSQQAVVVTPHEENIFSMARRGELTN